jgi:hypothetical protein
MFRPRIQALRIRPRPPRLASALTLGVAVLAAAPAFGRIATAGAPAQQASSMLAYSSASADVVQHQPPARSCRARGAGLYAHPDPRCTPGALNPAVRPSTIDTTICRGGWTRKVRPAESITEPEKLASMRSYGDGLRASQFEYDHLVPLELGGAVNDSRNLWPEPDYTSFSGFSRNPKDELERVLNRMVCSGLIALGAAQRTIARDWVAAYRRYG